MIATEILLSGNTIDLYRDEPIKIEYSVNDIRSISTTGKANFSRQFSFPATEANNILLNNIFDLNAESTFRPNKKVECSVLVDSSEVMGGYFQLTDIERDKYDQVIAYKATIYGYGVDLFKTIGDAELTALNLSQFNHTRNLYTIRDSWTGATGQGYVYPLIDYAAGFTYPTINGSNPVKLSNMRPAVYVKSIVDAIFSGASYTYQSNFFNSDYFKRLVIPNSNEYLTYVPSAVSNSNLFKSYKTTDQDITKAAPANTTFTSVITPMGVGYIRTAFENETSDPGNNFASTNGLIQIVPPYTYIVPSDDDYTFHTHINCAYVSGNGGVTGDVLVTIERDSTSAGVTEEVIGSGSISMTVTQVNHVSVSASTVNLLAGDRIYVRVRFTTGPTASPQVLRILGGNQSYFECLSSGALGQVSPIGYVDIANNLPAKVKQKDFINSLIKMFNLYVEPIGNRKLLIEPRDDFYTLGKRKDWTEKYDRSKPINIRLLSEVRNRSIEFTWADDNDFLNSDYKKQTNKLYGSYLTEIDNEFVEGKETIQPIFAATPLDNVDGSEAIILPKIYSQDDSGGYNKIGVKPRILYYAGLIDLTPYSESWALDYSPLGAPGFQVAHFTSYPYAGHLSDPYQVSGTTDLTWASPEYIYYTNPINGQTGYTSSGLYERFYKKTIEEISNPKSKLVTAYFKLDCVDIANLSFKDIVFFDNEYYRLNKVEYNALDNETSKVELLKLIESKVPLPSIVFSPKRLSNTPKLGLNVGDNKGTSFSSVMGFYNSISNDSIFTRVEGLSNLLYSASTSTSIMGQSNFVSYTSGSTITGNNNIVGQSSNLLIFGSYNTGMSATNSAIISGSGNTITGSNVTFIGVNNYNGTTTPFTTYVTYLNILSGLSISGQSVIIDGMNLGSGSGQVFSGKTGSTLAFRTLSGLSNITISTLPSVVNIGVVQEPTFSSVTASMYYSGTTNLSTIIANSVSGLSSSNNTTGLNVGSGSGQVYSGKTGSTLLFKTLSAGTNLTLTTASTVNSYSLNSSVNLTNLSASTIYSGSTNLTSLFNVNGVNLTSPNNVFKQKTGLSFEFRALTQGDKIVLTEGASNIAIDIRPNPTRCTDKDTTIDRKYDWLIVVEKNTNPITVYLPSSPVNGDEFVIKDGEDAGAYNITIDGNGNNIDGSSTFTIDTRFQSVSVVYSECSTRWLIVYDYKPPAA